MCFLPAVIIHNVSKSVDDARITEFLKPVGVPTGIRRVPEPFDDLAEQVFVGFSTLSKALTAAQMSITETLGGFTPFVFAAWTVPAMKDDNTVKLRFEAGRLTDGRVLTVVLVTVTIVFSSIQDPTRPFKASTTEWPFTGRCVTWARLPPIRRLSCSSGLIKAYRRPPRSSRLAP